jgi:hypothetical protein
MGPPQSDTIIEKRASRQLERDREDGEKTAPKTKRALVNAISSAFYKPFTCP